MKISKIPGLGSYGIFIDDIDLMNTSEEEWFQVGQLHLKSLVTILRNVKITKERYAELITLWGEKRVPVNLSRKYKKLGKDIKWVYNQYEKNSNLISDEDKFLIQTSKNVTEITKNNVALMKVAGGYTDGIPNGMFADGELLWHSNESGTLTFTPAVALLGWNNMTGSSTGFLTTPDYYESVSNSFRSELDDMILVHKFIPGKINPGLNKEQDMLMKSNMCPEDCEIPMVIQSPGGIKGLHFSFNTVNQIKGATESESKKIFSLITNELENEKYTYDHWYQQNNDLLLFDNSITQHRRLGDTYGRLAYRLPFDYTNLQTKPYIPYFQPIYQRRYAKEIQDVVAAANVNFKLPKFSFIDRIFYFLEN